MADTTLSVLFPGIPAMVAGERTEVRPILLRELRLVERVFEGWSILVASNGEQVDPEAWEAFLELMAGAWGKDKAQVKALEQADFESLVCLVLAINKDLWDPPKVDETQEAHSWAQIVQRLVKAGHPWESIMNMTLPQVKAFLEEGLRQERADLALDITAASFAMADGKTVQQVTKELRRG
jgi:hypothetical protein